MAGMDDPGWGEGRRKLVQSLGAGLLGAVLGAGTARAAGTAVASGGGAQDGPGQPVVLYGPDGRALPAFREGDPGNVRSAGRPAATDYAQLTVDPGTPQTVRRAPTKTGIWVQVERGEIRVRTDGGDATASAGEVIGAGFAERYDVDSLSVIGNGARAVVQLWSE